MHRRNRYRCPNYVPEDIMRPSCPAEIGQGVVLPVRTRREQREDVRELIGPALVPADPADDELREELEAGTLADDLRVVYRLRPWWSIPAWIEALRWFASILKPLDVMDAPGHAPAR